MEIDQSAIKGESGTGYEGPQKGPFSCSNCEYFRDNSCGQKIMMARSKQPKLPNGRIEVDPKGCCEFVDRVGETMVKNKKMFAPAKKMEEKKPPPFGGKMSAGKRMMRKPK